MKLTVLSDGFFELDMGFLVYGKERYYGKKYRCALLSLLIEAEDRCILVDTGIGEGTPYKRPEREKSLMDMLEDAGYIPDEVTDVVNTHLHFDHSGWNRAFRNAVFHVQAEELEYARNPHRFQKGGYLRSTFEGCRFRTYHGKAEVCEGVTLLPTPGHTPGHQSVVVGGYVFCGDTAPLRENLERRNIVGVLHDPVKALASLDLLAGTGLRPIFSHDNQQFENLPMRLL